MGEMQWHFHAKLAKKFSFAYLLLSFPPMLSEKSYSALLFLLLEAEFGFALNLPKKRGGWSIHFV